MQIVVEHFREYVAPLLDGKAKAMVVVGSRKEAVRWKMAIDKYIKDRGYGIGTLVAFSGEVNDKEIRPRPVHRDQHEPRTCAGRDIREAFNTDEFSDPAGGQQVPDRLRSAAAVRHVRGQAAGRHPGRADAVAAEPGLPRTRELKDTTMSWIS